MTKREDRQKSSCITDDASRVFDATVLLCPSNWAARSSSGRAYIIGRMNGSVAARDSGSQTAGNKRKRTIDNDTLHGEIRYTTTPLPSTQTNRIEITSMTIYMQTSDMLIDSRF